MLADGLGHERTGTGELWEPKLGEDFEIHRRWGTPCPRCDGELRRISYEAYEVTYCPTCQNDGTLLADRQLSRLVK